MPALTKAQKKQAQAAEDSFNRTYAIQFGEERWEKSLYPALTAPTRYAALINRFATTTTTSNIFPEEMASRVEEIVYPGDQDRKPSLTSYQWNTSEAEATFPPPQPDPSSGLMTHWNLDAASLLAVRILAPKPGDKVLDLCAAPGGKSVALSQLLRPEDYDGASPSLGGGCLHSNEVNTGRNKRLASNLQAYLPGAVFESGEVKVLKLDGTEPFSVQNLPLGPGGYDRVLLDAPCSSERHVVHAHAKARQSGRVAEEMTSWRSGQSKKMAKVQVALLMTALKAVRVGGHVLYATCSLSTDENDGVIEKGMELVQKERKKLGIKWDLAVRSGELVAMPMPMPMGGWAESTKYGWLALPDLPGGGKWGPLFFALLEKVEA
ncbi:S-adenosyl-L-methionine-dependent methyltransferase [Xylaria sp. CBS 124048]|nr:S-adenosyl-L-methionine-dependent methyltransferase [Xylaria sp. CBS 124048]